MGYSWADMFKLMEAFSPVLSNAAGGAASGKIAEQNAAALQNQNATSRYQAMVNANRLQNIEQPSANMNQASRGALMSTWQPMSITPASVPYGSQTNGAVMPKITGGPTITPEMRQTGEAAMKAALARLLAGNPINTSMFPSDSELGLNPLPQESTLDKILKWSSTGSSLLGALGKGSTASGGGASAIGPDGIPLGGTKLPAETLGNYANTASNTDKIVPIGGGGGGGGANARSPYADYVMKHQLADLGLLFDYPTMNQPMGADTSQEIINRQRIPRTRRG